MRALYSVRRDVCFLLFSNALSICAAAADPPPGNTVIAPADPLILQVQVVEGDGLVYAPGARAVKGITIRVTDEVGRPVGAAAVSFRLPDDGATGVFQNNSKTEIAATTADGRASVWGMRWGKIPGSVSIRITAAKGATRAGTLATQIISTDAPAGGATISSARQAYKSHAGGGSRKWLWITLAAAGAAGGGLLAYQMTKGATAGSAANATAINVSISPPLVTVGPH